eukprot:scaffold932_cov139-Skeletonema_menzelii.AAC.4
MHHVGEHVRIGWERHMRSYLERHLEQLQRDEPESMKQIQDFIREDTAVSSLQAGNDKSSNNNSNSSEFQTIDTSFYGWGAVAHKFLINSKLYALRDVLECGADAFITDTDIGFRKDPRPFFAISGPKGDIIAQNDTNPMLAIRAASNFTIHSVYLWFSTESKRFALESKADWRFVETLYAPSTY